MPTRSNFTAASIKLGRRVFGSVGGQAATFSAFAGMVSACAATVTLIAK
ncbi:hypothetical protein [Amycolatopsis sp. MEPSY49]